MTQKTKIFFGLIIGCSLLLNIFLLKRRIEIRFVSEERTREVSDTKASHAGGVDFYNDFESGSAGGWKGRVTKEIVSKGSKYALEVLRVNNPYFATATSKVFEGRKLKVGSDTRIEFDYFIKEGSILRIQCYCPKRRDNFYFDVVNPTLGEWKKLSVGFAAFRDNSHTGLVPQRGDEFSNIQIYGGRAGEDTFLVIDNFKIVEGD